MHERIRVRQLAASHRLERMRRLRMLEEQEAWKREGGFDRIEIIPEMHAQRLYAGFDSEHLYTGLYTVIMRVMTLIGAMAPIGVITPGCDKKARTKY